jgi:transcriptional regulator with XRE-family HTH domain
MEDEGSPTEKDKGLTPADLPGWKMISAALEDVVSTCGIPVETLAERIGVTRQYVYAMINGKCNPTVDKIEPLFNAAGVSFAVWLDDKAYYGRDRRFHDKVQTILNQRGANAIALRQIVAALHASAREEE